MIFRPEQSRSVEARFRRPFSESPNHGTGKLGDLAFSASSIPYHGSHAGEFDARLDPEYRTRSGRYQGLAEQWR